MARLQALLKSGVTRIADHIWPPLCAACEAPVLSGAGLCPDCWDAVTFLDAPQCHACGVPLPYDPGPGALCGDCTAHPPPFARARAGFVYDAASRPMILAFKHADRTDLAPALVNWLKRPARELLADAELIAPVPLHWSRLLARRYNQAALLAHGLGWAGNVRCVPDLLTRTRNTGTQGGKSGAGRRRNVTGAFRVPPRHRALLRDKRVLLVDDVMTTGATLAASARALLKGGATAVDAVTVARVVSTGL